MKNRYLQKNCFDLEYQRSLYILNSTLSLGTGSGIAFFGGLILDFDKWFLYSAALVVICSSVYFIYRKTNMNLKKVSNQIRMLENE